MEFILVAVVRQARVLRNVLGMFALWTLVVWLVRPWLWKHAEAFGFGIAAGLIYGQWRWWRLQRRIARRDRRYERNKIFVQYLTWLEALLAAVVYNPYLGMPLGLGLAAVVWLAFGAAPWWTALGAGFGLAGMGFLAGCIIWNEHRYGPLYYQYNSDTWSGAEGLLYQQGTVVQPLMPAGKVRVHGVVWNAISLSGESLAERERVEVIAIERLTLYVDRLPEVTASHRP